MKRCALLALAVTACSPSVGTACDEGLAHQIVFDERGSPAYAGQSIFVSSCAGGGWACHSSQALHRFGAPAGTDFDVMLADDVRFDGGAMRLQAQQANTHRLRDDVFSQVSSGNEPPGAIGARVIARSPVYRSFVDASDTTGTAVPSVRSADGREVLRNWLACGSPVVERTSGSASDGGDVIDALPSTTSAHWSSLYDTQLAHSCGLVGCHDAEDASASGGLDLSTNAIGYASLDARITPADPDGSRVVQVLTMASMPYHRIDPAALDLVRAWITAGAAMD